MKSAFESGKLNVIDEDILRVKYVNAEDSSISSPDELKFNIITQVQYPGGLYKAENLPQVISLENLIAKDLGIDIQGGDARDVEIKKLDTLRSGNISVSFIMGSQLEKLEKGASATLSLGDSFSVEEDLGAYKRKTIVMIK